jgi:chaperonin cofactor prefoldin
MKFNINGKEIEVADEELSKALEEKKESLEIKAETLIVRTSEEDTTFRENFKRESMTAGIEVGRKNIIKALGIEAEGVHKSDETALEAINSFVTNKVTTSLAEAKIEPNKKVDELTKDLQTLQGTIKTKDDEIARVNGEFNAFKTGHIKTSTLEKNLPENLVIPKADMLTILNASLKSEVDENGNVFFIGSDGQPMKDPTTLAVLPAKTVLDNYFSTNAHYLKSASGGAGGADSGDGSGKQTLEDFTKEMTDKNIRPNSAEFNTEMSARMKAGTLNVG